MAYKARRRPSWKKKRSKYLDRLKNKLYDKFALEIRKEIDKEILEELRSLCSLSKTVMRGTANP